MQNISFKRKKKSSGLASSVDPSRLCRHGWGIKISKRSRSDMATGNRARALVGSPMSACVALLFYFSSQLVGNRPSMKRQEWGKGRSAKVGPVLSKMRDAGDRRPSRLVRLVTRSGWWSGPSRFFSVDASCSAPAHPSHPAVWSPPKSGDKLKKYPCKTKIALISVSIFKRKILDEGFKMLNGSAFHYKTVFKSCIIIGALGALLCENRVKKNWMSTIFPQVASLSRMLTFLRDVYTLE